MFTLNDFLICCKSKYFISDSLKKQKHYQIKTEIIHRYKHKKQQLLSKQLNFILLKTFKCPLMTIKNKEFVVL